MVRFVRRGHANGRRSMMASEQEDKVAASQAMVERGHMLVSEAAARAVLTLPSP